MPSIFLKAQICVLQARGSSYSCSFPMWALCRYQGAPGSPRRPLQASQMPAPAARSRTAARVSLRPRPLRARPRGSARSRPARHLGYSVRFQRQLATVVRARSQEMGTQSRGKGMPAAWDSGPRSGSPPTAHESSLGSSKPPYSVNLGMGSTLPSLPPVPVGRVDSFFGEYFVRPRGCASGSFGAKSLWKHKVREPCPRSCSLVGRARLFLASCERGVWDLDPEELEMINYSSTPREPGLGEFGFVSVRDSWMCLERSLKDR